MNENEEKLIAAYQAGEDVGEQLLTACRANHNLLKELADFVAIDRLLQFDGQQDDLFINKFEQKLKLELQDNVTRKFQQNLRAKPREDNQQVEPKSPFSFMQMAAMVFLLIIPIFLMTFMTEKQSKALVVASLIRHTGSMSLSAGSEINAGEFSLQSGYAELMLNNGVQLMLEAPITLDFKNVDVVYVLQGNLVANVPEQATGFTVLTPSSEIIDLGTEFAIAVDEKGASEVHVIKGEVKARGLHEKQFVNLFKDDARAFDVHQQVSIIASDPKRFRRSLPGKSATNPDFLHWSFDDQRTLTVASGKGFDIEAFSGQLKAINGGIGPVYENGQFGQALFFNGQDAYVETAFKGIGGNKPRTVAFWAKVPDDFTINNGYGMVSWGLFKKGTAWQISPNPVERTGPLGRIRIGTMGAPVVGTTDLRDRRWHHIAVVMYGGSESDISTHILLYVDGQLENTSYKAVTKINTVLDDQKSRPLIFGRNIAFTKENEPVNKFFRGWLDEIFIFDAALDQQQIHNLMKTNSIKTK